MALSVQRSPVLGSVTAHGVLADCTLSTQSLELGAHRRSREKQAGTAPTPPGAWEQPKVRTWES